MTASRACNYLQNAAATTYKKFLQFYAKRSCKKQLRALAISISASRLTIGLVNDMFTERQNDDYLYKELASQSDFDKW